jgi:hypothetical protein
LHAERIIQSASSLSRDLGSREKPVVTLQGHRIAGALGGGRQYQARLGHSLYLTENPMGGEVQDLVVGQAALFGKVFQSCLRGVGSKQNIAFGNAQSASHLAELIS